jgi:ribosomal protein L28
MMQAGERRPHAHTMPATPKQKSKGLRRDKKARAPGKQPICGLYAAAKCAGIQLKSAADVEAFRKTCFANGLLEPRNGNWVGGTKEIERARICEHFGCAVSSSHHELVHGRGPITVKSLLKNAQFFKTKAQYMLEVHMHVVYVRSNGTKKALRVCDQRGKQMRFVNAQGGPDLALEPLLRQRVVSLALVTPPESPLKFSP